jgi:hypothetical protein
MELSETDKQRIRAEEIYRDEVRRELLPPKGRWKSFFNTALGLWMLSTLSSILVVGGGGWAVTRIAQDHALSVQNRETVKKLKLEVYFQAGKFRGDVLRATTRKDYEENYTVFQKAKPRLLDYNTATMNRYLVELKDLGDKEDNKKADAAIEGMSRIWTIIAEKVSIHEWEEKLPSEVAGGASKEIVSVLDSVFLAPFGGWNGYRKN